MFERELRELTNLCERIRSLQGSGPESRAHLVERYNQILDEMLDGGLNEPLSIYIEIGYDEISPRYLDFVKPWEESLDRTTQNKPWDKLIKGEKEQ